MCADWQTAETRSVDSGPLTGQCGRDWDWDWTGLGWHVSAATSREARCVCNVQVELGGWSIGRRRAKKKWPVGGGSSKWAVDRAVAAAAAVAVAAAAAAAATR